jgi:hypothetical protein
MGSSAFSGSALEASVFLDWLRGSIMGASCRWLHSASSSPSQAKNGAIRLVCATLSWDYRFACYSGN